MKSILRLSFISFLCYKIYVISIYNFLNVKLLSYCRLRYFGKCNFLRNIDLLRFIAVV